MVQTKWEQMQITHTQHTHTPMPPGRPMMKKEAREEMLPEFRNSPEMPIPPPKTM